jgi:2-keto-3-deoxy-L-rhamnonate aldolase RhmA
MRVQLTFVAIALAALLKPVVGQAQTTERLNPMIALHEKGLPVFGITHPSINAGGRGGRGGRGVDTTQPPPPPPAPPSLADIAKETLAYGLADFQYTTYSPQTADRFKAYMEAITAQGGGMRTHAFIGKVNRIIEATPAPAQARIIEQLNVGHAGIFMQQVETATEVRQAVAAMRFVSRGGIRPDTGIDLAAKYWGLTKAQYLDRADVWPINPRGELVIYAIVESRLGIENIRAIAAEPGISAVVVGAGTLGGVMRGDTAGFNAAVKSVAAACKEFKKACSYPANNPAEIERLMGMGFNTFTMQSRNQNGFDAIIAGRKVGGRPLTPR